MVLSDVIVSKNCNTYPGTKLSTIKKQVAQNYDWFVFCKCFFPFCFICVTAQFALKPMECTRK